MSVTPWYWIGSRSSKEAYERGPKAGEAISVRIAQGLAVGLERDTSKSWASRPSGWTSRLDLCVEIRKGYISDIDVVHGSACLFDEAGVFRAEVLHLDAESIGYGVARRRIEEVGVRRSPMQGHLLRVGHHLAQDRGALGARSFVRHVGRGSTSRLFEVPTYGPRPWTTVT